MTLAHRQRALICDLFLELGPDAPTLDEGWETRDLASHLWVREHKPQALLGIVSERYAHLTQRLQDDALKTYGFEGLVERLRKPALLIRPVDAQMNGAEYFIHHMDVLRANDRDQSLSPKDEETLRGSIKMFARGVAKKFGNRLVLDTQDGKQLELGHGNRPVHVVGKPSEIIMFISGRTENARVELIGEPEAVKKLAGSATGL